MTEVFIIENSWYVDSYIEGHANLKAYPTEDAAKEALSDMAFSYGINLTYADTSFEDGDDTFYINRYEIEDI